MLKRRSTTTKPPDPVDIYLDENLSGPAITDGLRSFSSDWTIHSHYQEGLSRSMPDLDVVRYCAVQGWTIVTCDGHFRSVPANVAVAKERGVKVIFFGGGTRRGSEYQSLLIVHRSEICKWIRSRAGHAIARISKHGLVKADTKPRHTLTSRERTEQKYGGKVFDRDDSPPGQD